MLAAYPPGPDYTLPNAGLSTRSAGNGAPDLSVIIVNWNTRDLLAGCLESVAGNWLSVNQVVFFRSETGREPVREWLKELTADDRKTIGEDMKLVQFRWPLGMPLVGKLDADLWEVRSRLPGGRIARVCFTVGAGKMVLLHGFIKKTQKMPLQELELARRRRDLWWSG